MKLKLQFFLVFFVLVFTACSTSSKTTPNTASVSPSPEKIDMKNDENGIVYTNIDIDGGSQDWDTRYKTYNDPSGDAEEGFLDFGKGQLFVNENALYFQISLIDPQASFVHFDIQLEADDRFLQISWKPDMQYGVLGDYTDDPVQLGEAKRSRFSFGSVLEGRIDLQDIGTPEKLVLVNINIMAGNCCDFPDWRTVDQWQPSTTPTLAEKDAFNEEKDQEQLTTTEEPAGQVQTNVQGIVLDASDTFSLKYSSGGSLQFIAISPEGDIFGVTADDTFIKKIEDNGEISIHLAHNEVISCLGFDSHGNLWFTAGSNRLYKLEKGGKPELIIDSNVNRVFYFDDQDNLYAVDFWGQNKNIQKISPDGKIEVIAENLDINKYAVGKNGEIAILNHSGEVQLLTDEGDLNFLAGGYYVDIGLAFSPQNELYVFNGFQIHSYDITTGKKTDHAWFSQKYALGTGIAVFDQQGILYGGHPNHGIYAINFDEQSVTQVFQTRGNTNSMAIDDKGNLYVAYGNELPEGQTTLFKVIGPAELEEVTTIPSGQAMGLAIDDHGVAYLGTRDPGSGIQQIFAIDLESGQFEVFAETETWTNINSITIHPVSGAVWWSIRDGGVFHMDSSGEIQSVNPPANNDEIRLAFGPDGTLYATLTEERATPTSTPHIKKLLVLDENRAWQEIADLTTQDPTLWLVNPVVCPNGSRYILQSIDAFSYGEHPKNNTFNAVIRIEADNSLSLLGYNFSYDAQAAACDRDGNLYFTSGLGIYQFSDN